MKLRPLGLRLPALLGLLALLGRGVADAHGAAGHQRALGVQAQRE